jgi:L-amino acid N-acyltransferase YncA
VSRITLLSIRDHGVRIGDHGVRDRYHGAPIGDHGAPIGDHGVRIGDHGAPIGDHGVRIGDHGAPIADHGAPIGDHGAPIGDHRVRIGDHDARNLFHKLQITDLAVALFTLSVHDGHLGVGNVRTTSSETISHPASGRARPPVVVIFLARRSRDEVVAVAPESAKDSSRLGRPVQLHIEVPMASLSVQRATDRDLPLLVQLCSEATAQRGMLWSLRRTQLNPAGWISGRVPVVVVRDGASVIGFAAAPSDGVPLGAPRTAEALAYTTPSHRKRGAARAAMSELLSIARQMGLWKMIAHSLPQDAAARALLARIDFREVGVLVKHVQLEGGWHDVAISERLVLAARKSMPSISDA